MRSAFTLIELLVVISIIALLLAILLPSLNAAHQTGQSSVCASNLKQIYQGAFMHAVDNDDLLPHYAYAASRPTNGEWWPTQVAKAIDGFEPGIYLCPADLNPFVHIIFYYDGSNITMNPTPSDRLTPMPVTYRGHCDLMWMDPFSSSLHPRKFTDWKNPEMAMMMLEVRGNTMLNYRTCIDLNYHLAALEDPAARHPYIEDFERHVGQSNVLFIDGHVDSLAATEIGRLAANAEIYGNGLW
jgi:prepilin-type N-terminal cleavage/methylation domain-containing protein/prepilin-type processing-associated H-X9-DG protein